MFSRIVWFFSGGLGIDRHVWLFKHQIDHKVCRGPRTNHEGDPTNSEDVTGLLGTHIQLA